MNIKSCLLPFSFISLLVLLMGGMSVGAQEVDPLKPRVPEDKIADAKAMTNPLPNTPENIEKGKEIFLGKGTCFKCHGKKGKGNGRVAEDLDPKPRNLTNPEWQQARTDGEMFWVLKWGSPESGMVSLIPTDITEEEAWQVVTYVRTLSGQ